MPRSFSRIVCALVIIFSLACAFLPTPTPPPATEAPEAPAEQAGTEHEMIAGLTGDELIPFVVTHRSGESLGLTQEGNSASASGIVWTSPYGESLIVYAGDNGLPERAVAGGDVINYSNYTDTTVDIEVVHADGSREAVQAEREIDALNRVNSFAARLTQTVAMVVPGASARDRQQHEDLFKAALFVASSASCIKVAPLALAGPLGVAIAAKFCAGPIMTAVITAGKMANLNMGGLEDFKQTFDFYNCHAGLDPSSCLSWWLTESKKNKQAADETVAQVAFPAPVPAPVKPSATAPPALAGPATLYLTQNFYCRVNPCVESRDVTGFTPGTRLPILRTTNTGWWEVKIDLGWSNEKSCWIGGGIPEGDFTSVEIVEAPHSECGGGDSYSGTPDSYATP